MLKLVLRIRGPKGFPQRSQLSAAGSAGFLAALQLLQVGLDVHVYEQAPQIAEIGAGIQISPNALPDLATAGPQVRDGRFRHAAARGCISGAGTMDAPCSALHSGPRSRLPSARRTTTSIARILQIFSPTRYRKSACTAGHKLTGLEQKGERVIARFEKRRDQ